MTPELQNTLEHVFGAAPRKGQRVRGGDINNAYAVTLGDNRRVFVKTHPSPPPDFFAREAQGLNWLAEAGALRTPAVLAWGEGEGERAAFLALEMIEPANANPHHDEELGRGLAELHRFGANGFGLDHANFIGSLPQSNRTWETWSDFYANERLLPQLGMAERAGLSTPRLRAGLERLAQRLPKLVGPPEPPARLHGDLWGGNAIRDEKGAPCLIDPAVYGGHREVDLAMMQLFGGFSARCFEAYNESYPLAEGSKERVNLYQLYYLLVHLNLFGTSYMAGVLGAMESYL